MKPRRILQILLPALALMIAALFALPGYSAKNSSAKSDKIAASTDNSKMPGTLHLDTIVLGAGCFWGAEKRYAAIPGVVDAVSGYADGRNIKPSYDEITKRKYRMDPNNYAEVVQVLFNTEEVSLEQILKVYFETHDPTQVNRQGNDIGTQYRSTILTNSDAQLALAQRVRDEYQALMSKAGFGEIATIIKPLDAFHPAEDYHQDYLVKNPNGYCPDHSTGVKFNATEQQVVEQIDNTPLMQGKHLLVLEAEGYCPYCEKFRKDVLDDYNGTIPLHFRTANQLEGLKLVTATWATPTLFFIENGEEVAGRQGYLDAKSFYRALGAFKLGDSLAYEVAFNKGTEAAFCKQYDIFKNTPDGVFVDKLSGAPLFDTRDRFNSGTGWLSFTKPVDGQVYEKPDNSYGMRRTEIRSVSSDIHLGHVFDDGPNGQLRYCINANVLDFIPRAPATHKQLTKN